MITCTIWSDNEKMGWLPKYADCENTHVQACYCSSLEPQ